MIKRRLRIEYLLIMVGAFVLIPLLLIALATKTNLKEEAVEEVDYISNDVVETEPVMNTTKKIINPYTDPSVEVAKKYYDYQGEEKDQIDSIVVHDNTYYQNNGIDYVSENPFDVVSILERTVITIKEDENVGKTIEIKHEDGTISIYQSLGEINVKKGDIVSQGQVIGKSGQNQLEKELGNHLHFEIYDNGSSKNPDNYLNKEIKIEKGN